MSVHAGMTIPVSFPVCAKRAVPRTYGPISPFHFSLCRFPVPQFLISPYAICSFAPLPISPLSHSPMLLFAQFHILLFENDLPISTLPHFIIISRAPVSQFPIAPTIKYLLDPQYFSSPDRLTIIIPQIPYEIPYTFPIDPLKGSLLIP